jgi:hypothetical protein
MAHCMLTESLWQAVALGRSSTINNRRRRLPLFFMDQWLNEAPALLYVNNTWFVVNKWSEPVSWTEDADEAAWIVRCVLEREGTTEQQEEKRALKVVRGRNQAAFRVQNCDSLALFCPPEICRSAPFCMIISRVKAGFFMIWGTINFVGAGCFSD